MTASPAPESLPDDDLLIEQLDLVGGTLTDYEQGWQYQRDVHARVAAGEQPSTVLLLEHAPVYTAGKQTLDEERPFDGTPVVDVDRGGKITWHGPGQLVGYPIVRLPSRVGVVDHVRRMEQAVIDLLADYGLHAVRVEGRTGVWLPAEESTPVNTPGSLLWDSAHAAGLELEPVEAGLPDIPSVLANVIATPGKPERKICAIGIRVARRTTMHGFAINVSNSSAAFENIIPCGIADASVTSLAAELGHTQSLAAVAGRLVPHLIRCLDYSVPLAKIVHD